MKDSITTAVLDRREEPDRGRKSRSARFTRRVWLAAVVTLAVVGIFLLVQEVARVLLVAFGGIIFGVFLHGVSLLLSRLTRLPRYLTLIAVVLALFGLTVGLFAYAVPNLTNQISSLTDELKSAVRTVEQKIEGVAWAEAIIRGMPEPEKYLGDTDAAISSASKLSAGAVRVVTGIAIIFFVGLYTAATPDLYRRGVAKLVRPEKRARAQHLMNEVGETMWWWIIGRLISMSIIGLLVWGGLAVLGIPLAFLLGVLAGLLTFIPNIGAILAVIPPMLIAAKQGLSMSLYVLIYYLAIQFVESYVITPLVQKRTIDLPPVILLVAQAALAVLVGAVGVLFAAPLMAVGILLTQRLYVDRLENGPAPA